MERKGRERREVRVELNRDALRGHGVAMGVEDDNGPIHNQDDLRVVLHIDVMEGDVFIEEFSKEIKQRFGQRTIDAMHDAIFNEEIRAALSKAVD